MQARCHAQQPNVITYNATLSGLGDAMEPWWTKKRRHEAPVINRGMLMDTSGY